MAALMAQRNAEVVAAIASGRAAADVAREFGISRERARQIWVSTTGSTHVPRSPEGDPSRPCPCGERYRKGEYDAHLASRRHIEWRFWSKVAWSPGCWERSGAHYPTGYSHFGWRPAGGYGHRAAYILAVGPIPDGLTIDHLCRNRKCVNPAHLEPVTSAENTFRSTLAVATINAQKTRCVNGHDLSQAYRRLSGHRMCRVCRACEADRERRYRAQKKAA